VQFSAAHRELDAMREAGLARAERTGTTLVYRAATDHRHAALLRHLASASGDSETSKGTHHDEQVRGWLATLGAPLGSAKTKRRLPSVEQVVAEALSLSHRDATVARVLPLVLWRERDQLDFDRLLQEATRRDERQALGYFLELAGRLSGESRLVERARACATGDGRGSGCSFSDPTAPVHWLRLGETRRGRPGGGGTS